MPFEIRHETPGYLQALGSAAEEIGRRKRKDIEWQQQLQEEQLQLQREAQSSADKRYYAGLDATKQSQQAGYQHAEDMARLNADLQMKTLAKDFALRQQYGNLPGGAYRYTPAQVRDFEKKQAAIQQIMQSKSLRPQQKIQAVNQIMRGMRNILPMPQLPDTGQTQIQEAMKDRVFNNPDGTYWVLNGENMKLETPTWMITPDAYAKVYQAVSEMLTKTDAEGKEIRPDPAAVENFIANQFFKSYQTYLQLMQGKISFQQPQPQGPTAAPAPTPADFQAPGGTGEDMLSQIQEHLASPTFTPSIMQGGMPQYLSRKSASAPEVSSAFTTDPMAELRKALALLYSPPSADAPAEQSPTPTPTSAPWGYAGFGASSGLPPTAMPSPTPGMTPTPTPTLQGGIPTDIRLTDNVSSGIPTNIRLTDNASGMTPSTLQPTPTPTPTTTPSSQEYPKQVTEKLAPFYRPESGLLMLPDGSIYVLDNKGQWLQVREGKKQK